MSLLGNIVSGVTKAVTDPGALVSDAAKAVLPKNMAAVGDILGGIADIESGHPLQALSHLTDALKDLPQLTQGQPGAQAKDAAAPAGTPGAEPSPPPNKAASAPPTPESPKVNVQMVGKEMVISIDDGTHTTVIAEKPGQKPVVTVSTDKGPTTGTATTPATAAATPASTTTPETIPGSSTAPGTTPGSTTPASPPASTTASDTTPASTTATSTTPGSTSSSSAGASTASTSSSASPAPTPQSPKVSVERIGRETITSIDNGKRTTVIIQRPGHRPIVRTHADRHPASLVVAAGTSGAASTTNTGSTAPSSKPTTTAPTSTSTSTSDTSSTPAAASTKPASTSSAAADGAGETSSASAEDTSSKPASGSSASSSPSSAATPADLQSLMAMSPDQFMQAVTSGKIPDSVANSQSAMMQVQARMNQITQMNQLVTGMMAAMHQMEMSIIQNIRC